jgi:CheY-like chemotaxis protein
MQVLLVDDDPNARKVLCKMLQRAGHHVIEGENGLEGIARLRAAAVDLVLTDIVMPAMDGIEFIKMARQLTPSLKVIAMSGGGRTGNQDYLQAASRQGANVTLHKPFTSADLQSAIEQCFNAAA